MATTQTEQSHGLSFDVFCRVVDNFGDIGVCWRLVRQLAQGPHKHHVRLWVDDLTRFKQLEPGINTTAQQQTHSGVSIVHWHASSPALRPGNVVIEAFGCNPPSRFIDDMVAQDSLWLNLEYLSAEPWVDGFHLQPSVQANGLRKYFFFPGFTAATGGLLRETGLVEQRHSWQSHPDRRNALLQSCGVASTDIDALNHGARLVFVFCYPDAPVPALIDALSHQATPSVVLIPQGVYPQACSTRDGKVRVYHIPFVDQHDFDRLLWSADLNIVRGEDSLVRALWAARPMIWQPYPQEDDFHKTKLDAWLARSPFHADTQALLRSWSAPKVTELEDALYRHLQPDIWARWGQESQEWSRQLSEQADLATALVQFCTQHSRTG